MIILIEGNGKANNEQSTQSTKEDTKSTINEPTHAEPLTPEEIRWFYKGGVDKRWVEFCGYDSLRIEAAWQERQSLLNKIDGKSNELPPAEKVVVRGGMYDTEIDNMKCVSIYWPGAHFD